MKESHTDLDTSQAIPFTCEHCVCISVDSGTSPLSHTHEDKRFFRSCHLGRSLGVSSILKIVGFAYDAPIFGCLSAMVPAEAVPMAEPPCWD